ncbi:MAG TPA: hypothetical protein PKN58_01475, partial [Candidatus Marinimicrobia bacterium]|nr:hypothetical protein [Candidatus Neomarinimicrobiota bacterium]
VYGLLNQDTKGNLVKNEKVASLVNNIKELEKKLKDKEAQYYKIQESSKENTAKPDEPDQSKSETET